MTHTKLLEMLESDNIDEEEFNARLWCWLNDCEFKVVDCIGWIEYLNKSKASKVREITEHYLTSLDACKAVMDEHLQVEGMDIKQDKKSFCFRIFEGDSRGASYSMNIHDSDWKPSMSHAWLSVIIQAIAHKRGE